jgi:outer membrane lipoprotein SlyB
MGRVNAPPHHGSSTTHKENPMKAHPVSLVLSATALALVTACSSVPPRAADQPAVAVAPVGTPYGYVRDITTVPVESKSGKSGAVIGAVLGAVAGNQIGDGNGQKAAIAAGAVGGAVIGNQIQNRNRRDDEVFRVSVHFDDGREAVYDFPNVDAIRVGDRVKYEGGQLRRV